MTEFPVVGGLVGQLFANILADGFSRVRKGDRFWFEGYGSGLSYGKNTKSLSIIELINAIQ